MRLFLILITTLLLTLPSGTGYASTIVDKTVDVKLLTLNSWMIPFLRKKMRARSKMIGKYAARYDMIALQEVFGKIPRKLITKYINKKAKFENRFQTKPSLRMSSGLFNLTKYKITASSFKMFRKCKDFQCLAGKGLLHTRIRLPNGVEVDFFNTHMEPFHKRSQIRRQQLTRIMSHINKVNRGERPVVFAGDFNIVAEHDEYKDLLVTMNNAGFQDTWSVLNPNDPGYTWDSYSNNWGRGIDRSGSVERIDYVFIRDGKNSKVRGTSASIVFNKKMKSLTRKKKKYFLSDHFGLEVNLSFTPN